MRSMPIIPSLRAVLDRLPRLTTRRNLADLEAAVFELRDRLAQADPDAVRDCPAYGCCGCGAWMADVVTQPTDGTPYGESYCWRCVRSHRIDGYLIMRAQTQGGQL